MTPLRVCTLSIVVTRYTPNIGEERLSAHLPWKLYRLVIQIMSLLLDYFSDVVTV